MAQEVVHRAPSGSGTPKTAPGDSPQPPPTSSPGAKSRYADQPPPADSPGAAQTGYAEQPHQPHPQVPHKPVRRVAPTNRIPDASRAASISDSPGCRRRRYAEQPPPTASPGAAQARTPSSLHQPHPGCEPGSLHQPIRRCRGRRAASTNRIPRYHASPDAGQPHQPDPGCEPGSLQQPIRRGAADASTPSSPTNRTPGVLQKPGRRAASTNRSPGVRQKLACRVGFRRWVVGW